MIQNVKIFRACAGVSGEGSALQSQGKHKRKTKLLCKRSGSETAFARELRVTAAKGGKKSPFAAGSGARETKEIKKGYCV